MTHERPCSDVRDRLEALHDGELPIDEQIALHRHLEDCIACGLIAGEWERIGESLRLMAEDRARTERHEVRRLAFNVIERLRVEAQYSATARFKAMFQDMHLVWAGLGATFATLVCMAGSAGVLHAASQERPDSLAGVIAVLANPGSNANPLRLDAEMLAPRVRPDSGFEMSEGDAVLALAAVLTREGRLKNIEVLAAEQATKLKVRPEVVLAMLEQASRAQFEPAQARGGHTVAVNMVWLLTSTTVVGRPDDRLPFLGRPWRTPTDMAPGETPLPGPPAVSPVKIVPESFDHLPSVG